MENQKEIIIKDRSKQLERYMLLEELHVQAQHNLNKPITVKEKLNNFTNKIISMVGDR
ncbi:hypothetical protein [Oceanobacillus sp. CAU 1775]